MVMRKKSHNFTPEWICAKISEGNERYTIHEICGAGQWRRAAGITGLGCMASSAWGKSGQFRHSHHRHDGAHLFGADDGGHAGAKNRRMELVASLPAYAWTFCLLLCLRAFSVILQPRTIIQHFKHAARNHYAKI